MKEWILSHKKILIIGIVILLVLSIIPSATYYLYNRKSYKDTENTILDENQIVEIVAWGEVKYSRMKEINIDFPSIVTEVIVQEGDRVTLGQPLVTLDLSEYSGNIKKLEDQLSTNQSAMLIAEQDILALQVDIEQMKSQLARKKEEYNSNSNADLLLLNNSLDIAMNELISAETDLNNYQVLYEVGAVSKVILNDYKIEAEKYQKNVNDIETNIQKTKIALKEELDQLNVSVKSKEGELSQLQRGNTVNVIKQQGAISSVQVDLDLMRAKTNKEYFYDKEIISDIKNGIVQAISVNEGSNLGLQGLPTKVLEIIDIDSIVISTEVDEDFIRNIELGESVEIVPTSLVDTRLIGTVTQIPDIAVEKDGRRIVYVLVEPKDPDYVLKPGYTVDVYFRNK